MAMLYGLNWMDGGLLYPPDLRAYWEAGNRWSADVCITHAGQQLGDSETEYSMAGRGHLGGRQANLGSKLTENWKSASPMMKAGPVYIGCGTTLCPTVSWSASPEPDRLGFDHFSFSEAGRLAPILCLLWPLTGPCLMAGKCPCLMLLVEVWTGGEKLSRVSQCVTVHLMHRCTWQCDSINSCKLTFK